MLKTELEAFFWQKPTGTVQLRTPVTPQVLKMEIIFPLDDKSRLGLYDPSWGNASGLQLKQ